MSAATVRMAITAAFLFLLLVTEAISQHKSLVTQAENEALEAALNVPKDMQIRAYAERVRWQAAAQAAESAIYLSGRCDPHADFTATHWITDLPIEEKCDLEKAKFQRNYWFALQGDYMAQKLVAGCFDETKKQPCGGTVRPNSMMNCAWLLVMLSSGSADITAYDVIDYRDYCEERRRYLKESYAAEAFALYSRIYRKPLPGILSPR